MSTQIIPLKDRTDLRESAEWGDTVDIAKALRCEGVGPTFISMSLVLSALRANAAAAGIDPKYLTVDPDDKPAYAQWRAEIDDHRQEAGERSAKAKLATA